MAEGTERLATVLEITFDATRGGQNDRLEAYPTLLCDLIVTPYPLRALRFLRVLRAMSFSSFTLRAKLLTLLKTSGPRWRVARANRPIDARYSRVSRCF